MPPERVLRLKLESGEFQNLRATQKSGPLPRKKVSLGKAGGAAGMAPKKAKPRAAAEAVSFLSPGMLPQYPALCALALRAC